MPHKYGGFREPTPKEKENRCPVCWQFNKEEQETVTFQGEEYHKECFDSEMSKPLHKRFKRRRI